MFKTKRQIQSIKAREILDSRGNPTVEAVVILHDIRPMYCGVQMVIFRVICMEKSAFSTVSVWFLEILLS